MIKQTGLSSLFVLALVSMAMAVPPTLPNEASYFVEPVHWQTGDLYTTYQQWDIFSPTPNPPNETGFYQVNPAGLALPSAMPEAPGFFSTTGFYAFGGDYSFFLDIKNHGGPSGAGAPDGHGTHVVFQALVTQVPLSDPNDRVSLFVDSIRILDPNDDPIAGGSNAQTLRIDRIANINMAAGGHPFDVFGEEIIAEFFLEDYSGDFRIRADVINHGNTKQLRVDTILTSQPYAEIPIPGPRDINDDDFVNYPDYALFVQNWMGTDCSGHEGCGGADFDLDGVVDWRDLMEFMNYWLEG